MSDFEEFPPGADVWPDDFSRRDFVKLAAASLALAGVGCTRQPLETIVPYVATPEHRVQGEPQWFATAIPFRGFGFGVLAKSFEGRPVKLEGNPDHPASRGATNAFVQASILDLYDPQRSQYVRKNGAPSSWSAFAAEVVPAIGRGGRGLHILSQTITSPSLIALIAQFPAAKWHQWEPVSRDAVYEGTRLAFGAPLEPRYHFENADVVVALDADFLSDDPASVRYARDFTRRRSSTTNRLYALEPMPTITGAMADHRLPCRASDVANHARALAERIALPTGDHWIDAVARDLIAHRGAALVVAGDCQPPIVHALAHSINSFVGGGRTVEYSEPVASPTSHIDSLRDLIHDLDAGAVDVLIILGGNPVYDTPIDLDFMRHLARAKISVHLSPYVDETSSRTQWHLPESHPLEQWSDIRAFDGTATIIQPLIAPLYDTRSAHEVLSMLTGAPATGHDIVKNFWSPRTNFEASLARGIVEGTTLPAVPVERRPLPAAEHESRGAPLEINLRPDPTIWDGRHAKNGWLQELPKPITKLVWGSAAFVGPQLAERLHLRNEQVVEISAHGQIVSAPVWIVPGHADGSVTLHFPNAYPLLFSDSLLAISGASLRNTLKVHSLVSTQEHFTLDGRDHLRVATLEEARRDPHWAHDPEREPRRDETLYPAYPYLGHAWGMAIDLNSCIGCGACVIACNAENNIPFVGREQVARGRAMHWIRVDRYFAGSIDDPKIDHEPILCMHCENAPCEPVCPVEATVHSSEGLNEMVYNRCIGTRYCSNNCPYKVRRFNFLQYAPKSDPIDLMWNPDVTVRSRGVMEKCTYCVQRIERTRIRAADEHRPIRDGEIVTACQQACPAQAIVFGDVNDPKSRVSRLKAEGRNYSILAELNTRPRTTYLGKLRNPNAELEKR
jgi:molybdopterin-containing oxidoreductase family iron-sulfur binding subunit